MPALIDDLLNILLGGILLAYRTILLILALLVGSVMPVPTVSPAGLRDASPVTARVAQPLGLPNIVFILADDLDLDLDTVTTMPHLQALLAGQGITFTHFFVNASICCPSRASLLRGQYVHNHGVYTNGPPPTGGFEAFRDLGLENDTIATRLQDVGYRTALFGKYLNRYPYGSPSNYIPPGWGE
ncbi:MAG: sulfatase-like hydrolase/transferase, partial [Anaerolineae bacterium]